jgi:hypothetical protein
MFAARRVNQKDLQAGTTYRCQHDRHLVANATVLGFTEPRGIPHVRFDLSFERPSGEIVPGGARILALDCFTQTFRERVRA